MAFKTDAQRRWFFANLEGAPTFPLPVYRKSRVADFEAKKAAYGSYRWSLHRKGTPDDQRVQVPVEREVSMPTALGGVEVKRVRTTVGGFNSKKEAMTALDQAHRRGWVWIHKVRD